MATNKEIEAASESLKNYIEDHVDYSKQPNASSKDAYIYHAVKATLRAVEAVREDLTFKPDCTAAEVIKTAEIDIYNLEQQNTKLQKENERWRHDANIAMLGGILIALAHMMVMDDCTTACELVNACGGCKELEKASQGGLDDEVIKWVKKFS